MVSAQAAAARAAVVFAMLVPAAGPKALAAGAETVDQVAAELANPLAPVTTLAANLRAEMGNGPQDETNYQLRLQPSFFVPFVGKSALLVRTIVPLRNLNWPGNASGLGDVSIIPYYVPDTTSATFVGYGGALILPTATDDAIGSGKWAAGPAVIVARTGKPITWGGLLQHVWSVAGASERAGVSVTTVQPFLTYLLPEGWAATVSSESNYNWNAGPGSGWTVPLTLGISRVVQIGSEFVNFGLAYVGYLERPAFTTNAEVRFSTTYVWR